MRTQQEGHGCRGRPGNSDFLGSSREAGTHPALPSSRRFLSAHQPQPPRAWPPRADPGVGRFTVHGSVSAHQCVQTATQASEKVQTETRSHSSLDDLRGRWNLEDWLRPTLGSWGCRVWTSQPTCLGKPTPSGPPTPCPRLTAQARPRHQGQAAVFHACWDHGGGSERPVEWSPRCLVPRNTVQGCPAGQQRVDVTARLLAGRPHRRGTAGAPPR